MPVALLLVTVLWLLDQQVARLVGWLATQVDGLGKREADPFLRTLI